MSPFEPDPHCTEHSTATPTDTMACPPRAEAAPTASAGAGGPPSATPQPPQTVEPPPPKASVSFLEPSADHSTSSQHSRHSPRTAGRARPLADTATGLASPLSSLCKENDPGRRGSASKLIRFLPGHHAPAPLHEDHSVATTPQVDSYAISKIGQARTKVKRSFDKSKLLENYEYVFPRFELDELTLGKILGRGGFGTVLEIMEMETVDDEPEAPMKSNEGNVAEKSAVFRMEDWDGSRRRGRRTKSHSFRLRRPHLHGPHGGGGGGGHHFSLRLSNSHDGMLPGGSLGPISERGNSMEMSRSRTTMSPAPSGRGDSMVWPAASAKGRPRLRAKSLSWKHARAAAPDVAHFFHWSPKSQVSSEGGPKGDLREDEIMQALEKVAAEEELKVSGLDGEEPMDAGETQNEHFDNDDSGPKDDSGIACIGEPSAGRRSRPASRRVSRNFSFRSWRDSEAGEEGNDAISPEEMERYNIDASFFSTSRTTSRRNSMESILDTEHSHDAPDAVPGLLSTAGLRNDMTVETKEVNTSRGRLVLFSTPKQDGATLENGSAHQDKSFITHHATNSEGEARYVIKIISQDIVENDFRKFLQAAMDMATETYFLSVLSHPHIIKLRAVGQGDMFSPNYFLVLDRLYDTIADRVEGSWKQQLDHLENSILVWNRSYKLRALWEERMCAMRDLAGAIAHLHEQNVIYRDIKPENVGFDGQGNIKLFDFGLAKEVHEDDECANGTYKLTPCTGSIRYMAPENGNKWPYNFMTDSYSFGIMLWEVTALERPYASYTPREIKDMVMKWGERPKMKEGWSERVAGLMKSAWDSNFRKRPTMRVIEETLTKEIEDSTI